MIIISPSGKLYGSESVLIDYLRKTQLKNILVFVPQRGQLYDTLQSNFPTLKLFGFSGLLLLYFNIFFKLVFTGEKCVYCNEGGHIKYLILLARIFRNVSFFNHIRIKEDTSVDRIGSSDYNNLSHIVISDYLGELLNKTGFHKIYDPYPFTQNLNWSVVSNSPIRIGIVGRVTPTKGLSLVEQIIRGSNSKENEKFEFHFYGDIENKKEEVRRFVNNVQNFDNTKCVFHGFISSKSEIYEGMDVLFHANQQEALGRVILEALDFHIPVIGVNSGGVFELFNLLGLNNFCLDLDKESVPDEFLDMVTKIMEPQEIDLFKKALNKAKDTFDDKNYATKLDNILSGQA